MEPGAQMVFWGRSWPIKRSNGFWGLRGTAGIGFFSVVPKQKRGRPLERWCITPEYGKGPWGISAEARLHRIPPAHPPALSVAEKGLVPKTS